MIEDHNLEQQMPLSEKLSVRICIEKTFIKKYSYQQGEDPTIFEMKEKLEYIRLSQKNTYLIAKYKQKGGAEIMKFWNYE